jgi:hypothetical protein
MENTTIAEMLAAVEERILRACERSKRERGEVSIVAVTKTFGPDVVEEALAAGLRIFGENRVQEAAAKMPLCPSYAEWHLIGNLQRNKVRHALTLFPVIHAVDSIKLLEAIDKVADEEGLRPQILLEVNVSGEASKFGFKPDAVAAAIEAALSANNLTVCGLMTMAPFVPDAAETRPYFAKLRNLRDQLEQTFAIGLPQLSMGMSNDFEVAVEEGATLIRLGTVLFGHRRKWRDMQEE